MLPWLVTSRVVPALLGAPPYPMRNPGFTGPDPYDPYGPDTPEPRPYKNPGFEMCRTLLETYNHNVPNQVSAARARGVLHRRRGCSRMTI